MRLERRERSWLEVGEVGWVMDEVREVDVTLGGEGGG